MNAKKKYKRVMLKTASGTRWGCQIRTGKNRGRFVPGSKCNLKEGAVIRKKKTPFWGKGHRCYKNGKRVKDSVCHKYFGN